MVLKEEQINCQKLWGNLEILVSWGRSDRDKPGGAMPRSGVEGGEKEHRGVSSRSVQFRSCFFGKCSPTHTLSTEVSLAAP